MIAFGPVPSRRLGSSLGVNNIPPKVCSYSCVYCQIGRSTRAIAERKEFYPPERVIAEVKDKLKKIERRGEKADYIAFVPDGEPSLDANLGAEIEGLKTLGIKIAVITNSSLIYDESVRSDLAEADWVSVKIDAVSENIWRKIDRPVRKISLRAVKEGLLEFAKTFNGFLATETMLIAGANDFKKEIESTADFIAKLKPNVSYISVPTRPPAEKWAVPPPLEKLAEASEIFSGAGVKTELLIAYEGDDFVFASDMEKDLLAIVSVHPMREEALIKFLEKAGADFSAVEKLIAEGKLTETLYEGKKFYCRPLRPL